MKRSDLIAYNRRWVELHKDNQYQREAAKRITVLCNALERQGDEEVDDDGGS